MMGVPKQKCKKILTGKNNKTNSQAAEKRKDKGQVAMKKQA